MADLEQNLQELEYVKQAFKDNFDNSGVSTQGVEFRNMHNLVAQMEKILPSQVKEVTPTKERQVVNPDKGFKMTGTVVNPIPDEYIVPAGVKSITENGTYDVSDFATAQVDVAGESATLVTKEITENGTYNATDDNADGYSSVVVNIESSGGGGEEVIVERYTDTTALYNKAMEVVGANRFCYIYITVLSQASISGTKYSVGRSGFKETSENIDLPYTSFNLRLYPVNYRADKRVVFEGDGHILRLTSSAQTLAYTKVSPSATEGIVLRNVLETFSTLISGGYVTVDLCYI